MLSDKSKGKSALNAQTFLHVRDKVHVQAVDASIEGKQAQIKPFIGEIFTYKKHSDPSEQWSLTWISFDTDIKQTCLGQGLGVTITARKRPSKLMITVKDLGHIRCLVVKIKHLQVTVDVITVKSHSNHNVKQLSN